MLRSRCSVALALPLALALALAPSAVAPLAGADFMYRGDPSHVGVVAQSDAVPPSPHLRWRRDGINFGIHDASKSSPVADETSVYVGSDTGRLMAFDKRTGNQHWTWHCHPCRNGIHSSPAVDAKGVYASDYGGYVTALDKRTGAVLWESRVGDFVGSSPVLDGDRVLVGVEVATPDGYLAAVARDTGAILFQSPALGGHAHATPTVGEGERVYMGSNGGRFFCLDDGDGHEIWEYPASIAAGLPPPSRPTGAAGPGDAPPLAPVAAKLHQVKCTAAVASGKVLFTSWDTYLHCLDAADGHEIWRTSLGDRTQSSPAIDAATSRVFAGSDDGNMYALDLSTGHEIWRFTTGGGITGSPVVAPVLGLPQRAVLFGSGDRFLYMLDAATGQPRWKYRAASSISSVPLLSDHRIYLSTDLGELLCFE